MPENLEVQIRKLAHKNQTSLNATIIGLLEKAIGTGKKKRDLSKYAATWSDEEAKEFESNIKIFEKIDKEIWQ